MAELVTFEGKTPVVHPTAFLASTAVLVGDVVVEAEASIWYGAVMRADFGPIRIGPGTSIQDNCVIHAETGNGAVIGARVTVGHGAILHNCSIGNSCLIGMNAVVLDHARIGERSVVAAGAVVRERFECPPGMLIVGAPAAIKQPIAGRSADWVDRAAEDYIGLIGRYRRSGL